MLPPDTARLRFRHITSADLPTMFRLQSDPVTMQFIRAPVADLAAVAERLQLWTDYQAQNPDWGAWIVDWLDGRFAGYCVLREANWVPGQDLEVGYIIAPENWGQGVATEITHALCQYGFAHFPVAKLVAFIDPANAASRRVLEKCGFTTVGLEQVNDLKSERLELRRADFTQR